MNQQFRNVVYLSDRSGTGKWRKIWPIQMVDCVSQNVNAQVDYSQTPIVDQNYYKGMTSVTVQRWIADSQKDMFCRFLKPLMDQNGGWTLYEIDDFMFDGTFVGMTEDEKQKVVEKYGDPVRCSIPRFNRGRGAFEGERVQANIREMLNAADFVTVTTDYLKQAYHDFYGVPLENIVAVPNLLPRYLFGDRYDAAKKVEQFKRFKARPRVGIVSSLSHYNIDGVREDAKGRSCRKQKRDGGAEVWVNEAKEEVSESETREIVDDIDAILDCIRSMVDDVQWVFFGYCPQKLQDLAKAGKIEVHGGVPIMNYASKFDNLNLQMVVAAINPIGFNFCKSFIKTMECAALGVPCLATRCLPYSRVMRDAQLFSTGDELKARIMDLKFASAGKYEKIIEQQWTWLNSETDEGDFHLRNFWLEDNMSVHTDMFRLRQKTVPVSLDFFARQYEQRKKADSENTIFRNENILITK